MHPQPLVTFPQISLQNSELKFTHNTFRDCPLHFFVLACRPTGASDNQALKNLRFYWLKGDFDSTEFSVIIDCEKTWIFWAQVVTCIQGRDWLNTLRRVAFGDPATETVLLSLNRLIIRSLKLTTPIRLFSMAPNQHHMSARGVRRLKDSGSSSTDILLLS